MGLVLERFLSVLLYLCTAIFLSGCANPENFKRYEATWQSLDTRPIPSWYDEAKFGIFMHWGLYSVPSFGNEWFWYFWQGEKIRKYVDFMKKNYPPGFSYTDFAPMFTAEFFNPNEWADLVANAGARYYVITTKHHDGWTNWKSNASWNYNAVDSGPHRDVVAALAQAFHQRTNVTFGLYFSLFEWFHPLYVKDKQNQYRTQSYVDGVFQPQLYDLINTYKPAVLWTDGDWEASSDYWRSKEFLAWLYNDSPVKDTIVVNDRWGSDCRGYHGGVLSTPDKYNPKVLNQRKWEDCNCVDKVSWGYRRNANIEDFQSTSQLISLLVEAVSCGGNLLLNVGPTKEGTIIPAFQERLLQMGEWLKLNGQAIYSTVPWRAQNDSVARNVWYTTFGENVYATVLTVWPASSSINLGEPVATENTVVTMVGVKDEFSWLPMSPSGGITIYIPPFFQLPCQWAWVFKLQNVV